MFFTLKNGSASTQPVSRAGRWRARPIPAPQRSSPGPDWRFARDGGSCPDLPRGVVQVLLHMRAA
jgi:hypothetical protein